MKKPLAYLAILLATTGWVVPEDLPPRAPPVSNTYTAAMELPPTFDWRDTGYISPIQDQDNCGACWAFSAAAVLEFKLSQLGQPVDLSEQFLVNYSEAGTCEGGYLSKVSTFLTQDGDIPEECLPYTAIYREYGVEPCPTWRNETYHIDNWNHIYPVYEPEEVKVAIYEHGPVIAVMKVDRDFIYFRDWVYKDDGSESFVGYHSVVVTGWDDYQQCFIIKNSWGTIWGTDGFACVDYNEMYNVRVNFAYQIFYYGLAFQATIPEPDPLVQSRSSGGGGGGCFIATINN